jgi:hypothetical protein
MQPIDREGHLSLIGVQLSVCINFTTEVTGCQSSVISLLLDNCGSGERHGSVIDWYNNFQLRMGSMATQELPLRTLQNGSLEDIVSNSLVDLSH